MSSPYALVGKRCRVTLYFLVDGVPVPHLVEGRISDVSLGTNVAREGQPERLLDLAVVTGIEDYKDGEAVVPLHDVQVIDDGADEGAPAFPPGMFN